MTPDPERVPENLRAGRRALDALAGVSILSDWHRREGVSGWVLRLRLRADVDVPGPVPACTNWYVVADASYPWGKVTFCPDRDGGIAGTYPHQMHNSMGDRRWPWRDGHICLDTPGQHITRMGGGLPALGDPHARLHDYCVRALEWLSQASRGALLSDGDPFELPHFPASGGCHVAFLEDAVSFAGWSSSSRNHGLVRMTRTEGRSPFLAVREFQDPQGSAIATAPWGLGIEGEEVNGVWIRGSRPPVVPPWGAPTTWEELLAAVPELERALRGALGHLPATSATLLLVGFPIPERVGDPPRCMHWQALDLPQPPRLVARGFRNTSEGRWQYYRSVVTRRSPITWHNTENWASGRFSSRGQLPAALRSRQVLLLGAGAVGAPVGEMLVRGGVVDLVVMDGDVLSAGNLLRHTLGLAHLHLPKAPSLAETLNQAIPTARVRGMGQAFPPSPDPASAGVRECTVAIDCTAEDGVLHHMETFQWAGPMIFASLSIGRRARRLYCYLARADAFPHARFLELYAPWASREQQEGQSDDLTWEGTGCWHPVFPAVHSEILLMASLGVSELASFVEKPWTSERFSVYEQVWRDGYPEGVARIDGSAA